MKKLIITVCAVAVGLVANAAALNWQSWGYINNDVEDGWMNGGQAYLIQVTDATAFAIASDLTITGGMIVDSVALTEGLAEHTWTTDSLTNETSYNFAVLLTTDGKGMDTLPTTGFYAVDRDGTDTQTGFYTVLWDSNLGASIYPNELLFGDGASISSAVDAPEPTSGLLILLGMTGLALKRKQK